VFNTYQGRKIAVLSLLTLVFWVVILLMKVNVDKEKVQEEIPQTSLEPVTIQLTTELAMAPPKVNMEPVPHKEEDCKLHHHPENKKWTDEEEYLLAKIAMAEAEGESLEGKILVILTVLNRTQDDAFPDTIEDVVFESRNGVYQFSCVGDGRWYRVEPNEECWEAVRIIEEENYDYSEGPLYFESCQDADNWHSRNLEFLYQVGNHRFYK